MAAKSNSKPCQTSEMKLFPQVVTGFRDKLRILSNILDEAFCKNSRKQKKSSLFLQNPLSGMFGKVLSMLLKKEFINFSTLHYAVHGLLNTHGLICRILKAKIKRPVFRKLRVRNL